jgi:hypothetical protein
VGGLGFVCFGADVDAEAFVLICFVFSLGFAAAGGAGLDVRLGGLKGRRGRFWAACGSPAILDSWISAGKR